MLSIMLSSKNQEHRVMAALIEHVEEASQTIQLVRNNHQLFMIYRASKNMKLQLYGYLYTVTNTMSIFIC
jgi:EamA domain-containing membrane protein RarD